MKSRPPERFTGSNRGFSLAELLVSVAIVASSAGILAAALISANRSVQARTTNVELTQLLASRLAMLDETVSEGAPREGAFPEPFDDFRWTLELTDTARDDIRHATLSVTDGNVSLDLKTLRRYANEP